MELGRWRILSQVCKQTCKEGQLPKSPKNLLQQVAETFEMDLEGTSLKDLSRLDTCVTVVDASNLNANLKSIQKVKVRNKSAYYKALHEDPWGIFTNGHVY